MGAGGDGEEAYGFNLKGFAGRKGYADGNSVLGAPCCRLGSNIFSCSPTCSVNPTTPPSPPVTHNPFPLPTPSLLGPKR